MPKEWTDDEVKAEIAAAIQIVREDKIDSLIRRRLSPAPNDPNNPGTNPPPPGGNNPNPNPSAKRGSLWWGTDPE